MSKDSNISSVLTIVILTNEKLLTSFKIASGKLLSCEHDPEKLLTYKLPPRNFCIACKHIPEKLLTYPFKMSAL